MVDSTLDQPKAAHKVSKRYRDKVGQVIGVSGPTIQRLFRNARKQFGVKITYHKTNQPYPGAASLASKTGEYLTKCEYAALWAAMDVADVLALPIFFYPGAGMSTQRRPNWR